MSRILEEKFRQRSTSTGSLDGMVITRDNKLISLRSEAHYELARVAAAAVVNSPQVSGPSVSYGQISSKCTSVSPQIRRFSASDRSVNQSPDPMGEMNYSRVSHFLDWIKGLN